MFNYLAQEVNDYKKIVLGSMLVEEIDKNNDYPILCAQKGTLLF